MATSLRFVIPNKSLKLFASIVRCLAKIGEELLVEADDQHFIMKTLNPTRSAFVHFTLVKGAFEEFTVPVGQPPFKLLLKPFVSLFRSINNVERAVVELIDENTKLKVDMICKGLLEKKFKLPVDESTVVSATYNKEDSPHKLIARPKLFEDCLLNFASSVTEFKMGFSRAAVSLKSEQAANEPQDAGKKYLVTELRLDIKDFEKYHLDPTADVFELVMSLREFHPLLAFCEAIMMPLHIFLGGPGQPVIINVKMYNFLEADFVIATIPPGSNASSTTASQTAANNHQQGSHSTHGTQSTHSTTTSQAPLSSATPYRPTAFGQPTSNHPSQVAHGNMHQQGQNSYQQLHNGTPAHSQDLAYNHRQASNSHHPQNPTGSSQGRSSFHIEASMTSSMAVDDHPGMDDGDQGNTMMGIRQANDAAALWTSDLKRRSNHMDQDDEDVYSDHE